MAKEFYDWVKLALDNKWLVMLCFTGLSSIATNAAQFVNHSETEQDLILTQKQVAAVANHYTKPKPVKSTVSKIYKMDCGICTTLMSNHKKELH